MRIKTIPYKRLYNKVSQLSHDRKNDHRIPILVGRIRGIIAGKFKDAGEMPKIVKGDEE